MASIWLADDRSTLGSQCRHGACHCLLLNAPHRRCIFRKWNARPPHQREAYDSLLQYLLYRGGLDPNPQYLWVCPFIFKNANTFHLYDFLLDIFKWTSAYRHWGHWWARRGLPAGSFQAGGDSDLSAEPLAPAKSMPMWGGAGGLFSDPRFRWKGRHGRWWGLAMVSNRRLTKLTKTSSFHNYFSNNLRYLKVTKYNCFHVLNHLYFSPI